MDLPPPPRAVSPMLTLQMLFGGVASQVGWVILAFGSIPFWVFVWNADLTTWRFPADRCAQTTGEVLGCEKTSFSEGGSKHRSGTPIFRSSYRYTVDHRTFESASYAKGVCAAPGPARIEYLPGQPEISRIPGMRRNVFGPDTIFLALLPLAGLLVAGIGLVRGRTSARMLAGGVPVSGKLVETKATAMRSNNRTVYQMTFEYTAHDGVTRRTTARTNEPGRFEKQEAQTVLYDPDHPGRAVLLNALPGKIALDESGQLQARSRAFLILPLLAILGNLLWIWTRR